MSAAGAQPQPKAAGGAGPWLLGAWALVLALWLVLAFSPAEGGLAWVKAAQAACFGSLEDGLPAPWGWAVLLLAPASILAGLLAVYGDELRAWRQSWREGGSGWLPALALASLLALTLGWSFQRVLAARDAKAAALGAPEDGPLPEDYPRFQLAMPAFKLVDQSGRVTGPADFAGRPSILSFAYAHCATMCPLLLNETQAALKLRPDAAGFYIGLDPWRDTPAALPGLAKRFGLGPQSRLLTGPPPQVQALLKSLQVDAERDLMTGEISHAPLVYVLDRQGRIAYRFLRPSPRWLSEALARLQAEP